MEFNKIIPAELGITKENSDKEQWNHRGDLSPKGQKIL